MPNGTPTTALNVPRNFRTIQALRAVAALMVVAFHAFDLWALRVKPGHYWTNGAAGVDIFFVISGFVMVISSGRLAAQAWGWLTFMRHRIVRIVPLYWLLTTLKLVLVFSFAEFALRSQVDLDYVLRSYLFLPVIDSGGHFRPLLPVGWTLTYEFLFYLFFAVALALQTDVLRVVIPAFVVVCVLAVLRIDTWAGWTILFSTIVVEFLFGVLLAKAIMRGGMIPPPMAACAIMAGFLLIFLIPEGPENMRVIVWGLPALAIVAGAVSLETQLSEILPAWLLALGDASYSIYLVHGFVLPIIGIAVSALHWNGHIAEATTIIACLLVGSLAGWLTYIAVERPVLRHMKQSARANRGESNHLSRIWPSRDFGPYPLFCRCEH